MTFSEEQVLDNFLTIKKKVSSISSDAKLLAVSKFHSIDKILPLLKSGHRIFGESRLEEAVNKWSSLKGDYSDLQLHFIGGIQSRKISKIVEFFDVIQSVDRLSVAKKIASSAESIGKIQKVLIQINIGEEQQKSGVSPAEFSALYNEIKGLENIDVMGIMCIPPNEHDVSPYFEKMKYIVSVNGFNELSMGMSHDYELALRYDATIVRVGSFIFGERFG